MRNNGWSLALILLTGVLLATGMASPVQAQGTLDEVSFHSDALGQQRTFDIYLPAGYDPQGTVRYPVVYFLHGLGGSPKTYSSGLAVGLDFLIAMRTAARDIGLELFFDCGTRDELGLHEWNVSFADSLTRIGLPHEFQSYDGGHSDKIIDRLLISMQWVDAKFGTPLPTPTAVTDASGVQPPEFRLEPSYPNPFNAETIIPFTLPREQVVRLEVYSALGHRVTVLLDERLPAGRHTVSWRAGDLGSGVYFSRLKADSRVDTRPLLLLR